MCLCARSAVRNADGFQIKKEDVEKILDWKNTSTKGVEIPFKPARVLMQDFTCVRAQGSVINCLDCVCLA